MSEVEDNIRPRVEMAGSRSVRRDVRSVGWENWLRDDGGRMEIGNMNNRRFKL